MARILLTGASGLLGLNFALQEYQNHEIIGLVNQRRLSNAPFKSIPTDLSQPGAVTRIVEEVQPDVIVHCAAIANIDQCESMPEFAHRVNAEVPGEFAKESKKRSIKLVYISTDAVYDGAKGDYSETDAPNPLSVYAKTKLAGEAQVLAEDPNAVIARVNFFGWSLLGKRSLSEFFFNNLAAGNQMKGFTDVFFCPLQVNDLVDVLLEMVSKDLSGVYNTVSAESLTKYDFGVSIAKKFGFDPGLIEPISVFDGGLKAARSPKLTLSTQKLETALGHPLPDQEKGLARFYQLYKDGYVEKIQSFAGDDL